MRPKLVLELLQHDHFRSSGLVWLSLYLLFLAVFIATTVQAQRGNIYYELDGEELEQARWVSREELEDPQDFFYPPRFSLSGQLIRMFMRGEV